VARFAGREHILRDGLAFAPLTPRTAVVGTLLGVRRVLERIEEGRLTDSLPEWFHELRKAPDATLSLGVDLDAQPVPATLRTRIDFLHGLRAARLLGNFREPGLNLAGALTYDEPQAAVNAEKRLLAHEAELRRASLLLSVLSMPRPLRRLTARAKGKDTQVAAELDGTALRILLDVLLREPERFTGLLGNPESEPAESGAAVPGAAPLDAAAP